MRHESHASWNHPFGTKQDRLRDLQSKSVRGPEVDRQLEPGQLLDGKLARGRGARPWASQWCQISITMRKQGRSRADPRKYEGVIGKIGITAD
jgi:hypothetical protein